MNANTSLANDIVAVVVVSVVTVKRVVDLLLLSML